ncbi:hypothetical protein GCM10009555_039710 [Acrocarpospora macrocephala]|uniref:Lipoprotein n=1 Tax=Acrocarpospora macrocephala TaxID=150177 RepID=A0A5M3WMJ2_9ACTN|nr:hypothetical protein [Acrocarpospora macrocephala]GES09856.1 hypothetical protein Amac_034520 [Acrocarpospora macrocephala]
MRIVRLAIVAVAATTFLTACGLGANTALCAEATKALLDYTSQVTTAGTDIAAINKANTDLSGKLTDISAKADGDLKKTLDSMASTWADLKIDASDPNSITEFTSKSANFDSELRAACS